MGKQGLTGLWTLIYNVILFLIALMALYTIKTHPNYKIGLIVLVSGLVLVNVHSIIRWRLKQSTLAQLQLNQTKNIVPRLCPDYWNKVSTPQSVVCKNEFVTRDNDVQKVYRFGGSKTPNEYNLDTLSKLNNQQKCWNIHNDNVKWVDMQMQCQAAGQ